MKLKFRLSNDRIIPTAGLDIVGHLLNESNINRNLNILAKNDFHDIKNSDIARTYIGLLCCAKNDFESVREFKDDPEIFQAMLRVHKIPSAVWLRQRLDRADEAWREALLMTNVTLLNKSKIQPSKANDTFVPLDIDVSPFDNSQTKKEGVSRTYKGVDGYAPIFAYLGAEGYLINAELREGKTHCQKDTETFLKESILMSKKVTEEPILVRMDAGNDAVSNLEICLSEETSCDFIIKRNIRKESPLYWLNLAQENAAKTLNPREGKTIYMGSLYWSVNISSDKKQPQIKTLRVVFEVIERTTDKRGQILLIPEIEVNSFWTSLEVDEEAIIKLYHAHGTCEQFHSEIKTDMDLERFPSGKFSTNKVILELGILSYNILRIIGQEILKSNDSPSKRVVKRKRLKTVIQNLIHFAVRLVKHARNIYMNTGVSNAWRYTFIRITQTLGSV